MKIFKILAVLVAFVYTVNMLGYTCLVPDVKGMTPPTSANRTFTEDQLSRYGTLIDIPSKRGKNAAISTCKKQGGTHLYVFNQQARTYTFSVSTK